MKVIAFYLPQFHEIPENDEWWGEGFTEWVNVKKAQPLFPGHIQPKVPLNKNYYNLLDPDVQKWQAQIAKEHGVYGFCYYHYWFNGKMLLEKPMENMLADQEIDMPFCISWANEAWTKAWVGESKVLIPQFYGGRKEWEEHFNYMLPFFKDKRYICCDGKPLFIFYKPELIDCVDEMIDCFQGLAKKEGLPGLTIAYQHGNMDFYYPDRDTSKFDLNIEFQPIYARNDYVNQKNEKRIIYNWLKKIYHKLSGTLGTKFGFELSRHRDSGEVTKFDFDQIWKCILEAKPRDEKCVPGAFMQWDNTPRHGKKGHVICGGTPDKFRKNLSQLIKKTRDEYKKDMIFVFAWNEWAEGGYLEPDEENGYGYLEAVKAALEENDEFPDFE